MGQTDRQTDIQTTAINALGPTLWGRRHNRLPKNKNVMASQETATTRKKENQWR